MTDISPQPWPAPQVLAGPFGGRAPILLAVPVSTGQPRLTVLLRIILVIPHLVALWALGIVAEIIAVIGWFGALFTGRLPRFAEDYLSGYLHWQVRVSAYCVLLTEAYPPFTLGDSDYPVRVAIPPPGPLNRLAVFFRLILAIPAAIVNGLLIWGGWTIILFIGWLVTLVTGTMPASLHQAYAAVLRYYARYLGYLVMLTPEYPNDIFGDRLLPGQTGAGPRSDGYPVTGPAGFPAQPPSEPAASTGQVRQAEPTGYPGQPADFQGQPATHPDEPGSQPIVPAGQPFPGQYSPGQPANVPADFGGFAGPGQFSGAGGQPAETAPFAQAAAASPWQLVLSDGARKLIGLFLALGVILVVGYVAVIIAVAGSAVSTTVTRNDAINQVQASYATLSRTLSTFQAKSSACRGNLKCVTALDRQASQAFDTFGTSVRGTAMPNGASTTAADQLASSSLEAGQLLQRLGNSSTVAQYEATITSTNVQQILNQVDVDYQNLGTQLNAS